jgi:catechol 2,3-dioxygenase-like lactoylglutathione lyase family enzyme
MVQTQVEIKTSGIDHVVLWVSDLERSKRFYIDLLGMTVHHESDWQAFLWCGEDQVALFQPRDGASVKTGAELNHMALRMEPTSYEEVKARLEQEGIEVSGRPGDSTCVYFNDPDGHRLQLLYKGHDG